MDLNNASPAAPYDTWATAATNIQDAVDEAFAGIGCWWRLSNANGVYQTGGRVAPADPDMATNRLIVGKPLTVLGLGGPSATIIVGGGLVRCVYLAANTKLSGFTLTNGYSPENGGGASCETGVTISNCVISGNFAAGNNGGGVLGGNLFNCTVSLNWGWNNGSGAEGSVLTDCVLTGNTNSFLGGGADSCTLTRCVLTGNSSNYGGGAENSTLYQCILTGNHTDGNGAAADGCTVNDCLVTGNVAVEGRAVSNGTINNSTIVNNSKGTERLHGAELHRLLQWRQ